MLHSVLPEPPPPTALTGSCPSTPRSLAGDQPGWIAAARCRNSAEPGYEHNPNRVTNLADERRLRTSTVRPLATTTGLTLRCHTASWPPS
jgi:hypothetical protein